MKRRLFLSTLVLPFLSGLSGCTFTQVRRSFSSAEKLYRGDVPSAVLAQVPHTGIPQVDRLLRSQLKQLVKRLARQWGDKKVASPKEFVKYYDNYNTRALINFDAGTVRVETLATQQPRKVLKQAIVATLLTPENPSKVDLLSDKPIDPKGEPFLYGLVLDQDKKPIRYAWRANRYADYLLKRQAHQDSYHGKVRHFVTFKLAQNYKQDQQHRYANSVHLNAKRFKLESALVYAIIETESSFNPYAMSPIPAFGLMQVVPRSAGRDAHRLLYNKDGIPSKNTLFQPKQNIQYGSAYLHILFYRYLNKIKNPQSREYCVIAAYNTGSGNVLKAFDKRRDSAIVRINRMTPSQVYQHLTRHLAYAEARRYLQKVTANKRHYS